MLLKNSEAGAAEKEGRETPTGRIKNTGFSLLVPVLPIINLLYSICTGEV